MIALYLIVSVDYFMRQITWESNAISSALSKYALISDFKHRFSSLVGTTVDRGSLMHPSDC